MKIYSAQLRLWLFVAGISASLPCTVQSQEIDFKRDIAPILEERCWHCHGADEQESGLRLDLRPNMLRGGDSGLAAVVPNQAGKSYIIEVINHVDEDMAMPPDEDKLPAQEIELLTKWVQQGAVWPGQMNAVLDESSDHWSFQPVKRPPVPQLPAQYASKHSTPVDAYLRHRLAKDKLSFSKPADAQTLVRRASMVLTGLIPTPEEVSAFRAEYSTNPDQAYADLVDRLLNSPHFGERWAQHWLDVIRWAETNGSEANLYRKNAWVYRDYVVRSFNEDKPYDQFVREQIAGDSLGVGEATGFLVAGPHVPAATVGREPTAIRQARADRMDEVLQTVGASVMGMTVGCARCHNHKFDPISIQDYYSMTAVFQDIEFGSRFPEYADDHPLRKKGKQLRHQIKVQRDVLKPLGGWEENWGAFRELHFKPVTTKAIRIRFKMKNVGLDELEVFGPANRSTNLAHINNGTKVSSNQPTGIDGRFPVKRLIDGDYGTMTWRAKSAVAVKDLSSNSKPEQPWVQLNFKQAQSIDRLRLSSNREYFYDTDYLTKKANLPRYEFDVDVLQDDGSWRPWVGTWFVNKKLNEKHPERKQALAAIQKSIRGLAQEGPRPSFVGRFVQPVVTKVLLRGSPESPRDEVLPAGPAILDGKLALTSASSGAARRAEFAKWITDSKNPLTARVMVNRIWHHVYGTGIVPTTSDFGRAGAAASHPELLDWLAAEFVNPTSVNDDEGAAWSIKSMIRLMVMSQAFRQSSAPQEAGLQIDSSSLLLWRFPPKRVEAEVIRDSILQASGLLDRTVGGRSFRIHNEKKTYAQWQVVDNHGPDTWRRMLYQERMRRVDDQMFTAFDFPDCGQVRAKRPVSTTPLQALNLMNSDFVMEQSAKIAERALADSNGNNATAVHRCFQLLLGRQAEPNEHAACLDLANDDHLSLVCRALVNSNEFAFLP